MSGLFIRRPVATVLLTIGIILLGARAYVRLPIAALPTVERPTITVWAGLPGASAETMASSVAGPLERRLGLVPGITEMASFSASGGVAINMEFVLGTDLDGASGAVQAAINAAGPELPKDLPQPPIYYKANPSGPPVIQIAFTSDVLHPSEVYGYADTVASQKLAAVEGVARVIISGAEKQAIRVQADPRRLATMNLGLEDVRAVLSTATQNLPKGAIATGGQSYGIGTDDQLFRAADYAGLVVAWRGASPVRLSDVATVRDSVLNDRLAGWYDKQPAVIMSVYRQPDANIVDTVDGVLSALPELQHWMPPAIKVDVVFDRTLLIRASIADVRLTIVIATVLVVLVIALFLRRIWVTFIPAVTIPVSLAATLAAMDALGYTLDNLSLMALTIAVGFVIDDAVIVLENIMRLIDEGETPLAAALIGVRQMGLTILSITASLIAALMPVLFMPDVVGAYFREFGMTLVIAIVASAIVSLTLTPVMSGHLLSRKARRRPSRFTRTIDGAMHRIHAGYERSLAATLRHRGFALAATSVLAAATIALYVALPKGFMPTQDSGILFARTVTIPNISFAAMAELQRSVAAEILTDPAVAGLSSYIGENNGNALSTGTLLINLKPPGERRLSIGAVIERLRSKLAKLSNVRTFFTAVQDLNIGVQSGSSRYQYTLSAITLPPLLRWGDIMRQRLQSLPEITDVISNAETAGLEEGLTIDRSKAASKGVTPLAIDETLYDAFGERQIGLIYLPLNNTRIVLEVPPQLRGSPAALSSIYVPGPKGAQIPLTELTRSRRGHAPLWVHHTDQFPSLTISFDTRPGVSIGQAIAAIGGAEAAAKLPDEIKAGFRGEAGEASKSGRTQLLLFLAAIFSIYVVLGVLYESFVHPLTIFSTLPSAATGALLALALAHAELDIMTAIACILVVGMVLKNAILMVDFALVAERKEGLPPEQAIAKAAARRFRPIAMTMLAAILGALPLALGSGPGHELRQPLGIAIVGGLFLAQILTLYTTPVAYVTVARLRIGRYTCGSADPATSS